MDVEVMLFGIACVFLIAANPVNRERLNGLVSEGRITVLADSEVRRIDDDAVTLDIDGNSATAPNDDVIVLIGGVLPTTMLARMDVAIVRHFGEETERARDIKDEELFSASSMTAGSRGQPSASTTASLKGIALGSARQPFSTSSAKATMEIRNRTSPSRFWDWTVTSV